jgi:hypothetical protein
MFSQDPCDLLHIGARSLGSVHFEERFEDRELLDNRLPLLLRDVRQVGLGSSALSTNRMIREHFIDWNSLESSLADFAGNNGVQRGAVHDYETSLTPLNGFSRSEPN